MKVKRLFIILGLIAIGMLLFSVCASAETSININSCTVNLESTYGFNGYVCPEPTINNGEYQLVKDVDYQLSYKDNDDFGIGKITITGIGNYSGSKELSFEIKLDIASCTVDKIKDQKCVGYEVEPQIVLRYDTIEIPNECYSVSYSNNINAGIGRAIVLGDGDLTFGSLSATFKMNPQLNFKKIEIYKGKKAAVKLDGAKGGVKYSTSKSSVCTVSSKGVVKGKSKGTAIINVKYDGKNYKCTVKVKIKSTISSDGKKTSTKYYSNNKDVPDFGAMLKISPSSHTDSTYTYRKKDVQDVDKNKTSGDKYKKLLKNSKFIYKGIVYKSGKKYYKYKSEKKIVYFGDMKANGVIKIIIEKA